MCKILYWAVLLSSLYLSNAGYGVQTQPSGYAAEDMYSQSAVESPAYVPSYMKYQKSYSSSKTSYGTKSGYGGTKSGYGGTKTGYGGTKTGYGGTNTGYGGAKPGYSETKTWYSNSGSAPTFDDFHGNANEAYTAKCTPDCKNNGICIDTNTCDCPANYRGKYCEFERKPCLTFPPLPMNSRRKCSSELCTITCAEGHKFIDGTTVANMRCMEGHWQPSRADLTTISDCEPQCEPRCQNGGVCLSVDTCQCPTEFRGPQCQFATSSCDVRKLAFNGGYNCFGDADSFSCKLTCPAGSSYSSPQAEVYCCQYSTGQFEPQPIPHCVFEEVIVVTPSNYHHNTYYEYHSTNYSSGSHSLTEAQRQMEYEQKNMHYGQSGHGYGQSGHGYGQTGSSTLDHDQIESVFGKNSTKVFDSLSGRNSTSFEQNITDNDHQSHYGNVKIVVQDLTPKGGVCLTWAGVHYKTFDGKIYSFESPCQHILVREQRSHKFTIAVKPGRCERPAYCPSEITVYLEDKPYVLTVGEDGAVLFLSGKRSLPIPASLPGIRVSMPGDYVIVNLDSMGVTLKWDANNIITVESSVLLWNNTEGLCGTLNGNLEDDFMTKEGSVAQTKAVMASSWQLRKIDDEVCESNPSESGACANKAEEDMARALKFCTQVFTKDKFRKCAKVMDVSQLLETCQWDYCACASSQNAEDCACSSVSVYAKECLRHGVNEMKIWRDEHTCPMKCPEGKLYNACGTDSQPSCAFPIAPSNTNNTCVEGCFCPEGLLLEGGKCVPKEQCPCRLRNKVFQSGSVVPKDCNTCTCASGEWKCTSTPCGARCSAMGDPHYTTFDGRRYDFMGHCTYHMLQTKNLSVEVENVACSGAITEAMNLAANKGEGKPSCTKAVNVNYGNTRIHLKQGGFILVNGEEVNGLPVTVGDVKIRTASSLFLIVQIPNKVDLWWDGNTRVYIDVPPAFHDQTKGLCGTFNLNQADDFLTPEGDIEQSAHAFANKWKTREFCDDVLNEEPQHPCTANVQNKETAEKYCSKLKSKIFEECHTYVDVEPYYSACLYDMCACEGDAARCLCPLLGAYGMQCADSGVITQWRYNVKECELSCTGGQEYTVCADSCQRTCSDVATSSSSECRPSCVEGCACPPPQVLNSEGVCVPVGLCPCYHKGMPYKAGYKEVRPGARERELCTCTGAIWECVPATARDIEQYPPADDVSHNCSAAHHREFTSCELGEPLTCKNMHLPPSTTSLECRPGCQCKKGYVLDSGTKQCVLPTQCPCHHGGRSYPDGHVMVEGCNQCECRSGNWSCTTHACSGICAAWGDSHVGTFDGTEYEFEGVCTYVLAKGVMEGKDGFSVEIQNVPCGTTGATCSKSVTLRVSSKGREEAVVLTRDVQLPDVGTLSSVKLRKAGAFVFVDVPSMGVSVQWDGALRVYVKVDSMWQGRVKGLCGNYNGDMRDDFISPAGGLPETSALLFADSWKMKPTCAKPSAVTDHCVERPDRKEWAMSTCGALKRYPFTLCHSEVPPTGYIERCTRDGCACDAGGDCECACAALAAYADHCQRRGVTLRWRTKELCPMQCDEECSTYEPCMTACPIETCDNTLYYTEIKTICERDTCVEGCKPNKTCPEGSIQANTTSTACIPRTKCRPVCMTLADGTKVLEGEVLVQDQCHTCTCSKGHRVCSGVPCSTQSPEPRVNPTTTTSKPHDEPLKCVSGWTEWVNRGQPETEVNGHSIDLEPLPKFNQFKIGTPMCKPEQMKQIECRTTINHLTAKETGLNVECSLEKGLICKEKTSLCPDFEIRVLCTCEEQPQSITEQPQSFPDQFQCLNSAHPNYPHPTDCTKFYECTPDLMSPDKPHAVLKSCPDGLMYDEALMICDWPASVIANRPQCGNITETTSSTTKTTVIETETTNRCPTGQVYKECAIQCNQLCDYFKKTLVAEKKCMPGQKCLPGCVDEVISTIKCDSGSLWRDEKTCVPLRDCTCYSDGKIIKPGGTKTDDCIKCQCLDNALHCDYSECVSLHIPDKGITHEAMIVTVPDFSFHDTFTYRPITERITTSIGTTISTTTQTKLNSTTIGIKATTEGLKTNPSTVKPISTDRASAKSKIEWTVAPPLIVKSTATPPPACSPDGYKNLVWGDEPLPDSAFKASSVVSALFEPQFAVLNGHPMDITAGSWNPALQDTNQFIQVTLPERQPIYTVIMQGSPLFDQYVTSYELMYSDDGVSFSTVDGNDGKPKVFRGPVDHDNPSRAPIEPPIEARVIRICPLTWHEDISVRFELIGCTQPVSATTPEPLQCTEPLGLAADLPLENIEVSSNNDLRKYFKLDGDRGWKPLYSTPGEWIMFDFTSPRNITGVKTKGGPSGWVSTYNIMYSADLNTFNPVLDDTGSYKMFPGNFDKDSVVLNEFKPPLHARYLKVVPLKWKNSIEMMIEPIGCFEPYPVTTSVPIAPVAPSEVICELCPGVHASHCPCDSTSARYFDGDSCGTRDQCPCVQGFITYGVGSSFRGANCDECVCKLGGVADCKPIQQCQCAPNLVPKLSPLSCECLCEPCPNATRICPTSKLCLPVEKWCDGLQDCPDDERECTTVTEPTVVTTVAPTVAAVVTTVMTTTTVKPIECPPVKCPPGYAIDYTSTQSKRTYGSDIPPPRPRNTYSRYFKGSKGGYTKGGYTKGGYAKGGFTKTQSTSNQAFTLQKPSSQTKPKTSQECVQFRCIPPLPLPAYEKAPVCATPACPAGYTINIDGVQNDCPLYSCTPPPELPYWCNVTGRTFNTFDEAEFKYDVCFHILARENRNEAWTVLVRKKCRLEGCINELLVHQDDQLILIKPNLMIEYDNYEYTVEQTSKICFQKNSFDVHKVGNGLAVKSRRYNFTVLYNTDGDVKIGVYKTYMGSVDGLCGSFDGDSSNERRLPDGTLAASVEQFGKAWAKPGLPPNACQTKVISAERQERAWKLCDAIIQEPISQCGHVLNLDKWRSICLEKICECSELIVNGTKRSEEQCLCLLLDQLVAECLAADRDVGIEGWRIKRGCPAVCPAPLVHYDCYRRSCEPTCSASGSTSADACAVSGGVCFPGCFCPEGWLRKGEQCVQPQECKDCTCMGAGNPAKHVTFEGDDLPYLANCTYLVSRDRNTTGHKYEIFATNGPCEGNPAAVCVKSLHVIYDTKVILITKDHTNQKLLTTIDKEPVFQYPVDKDWVSIYSLQATPQEITLEISDVQLELSVRLPNLEYHVRVPSYVYSNRTEGLCGVCAGYMEHLLTSNGTPTDDLQLYGKSWQATTKTLSTLDLPETSCEEVITKAKLCELPPPSENPCYQLYNADRFGACHPLVDPQPYVSSCESELCAASNKDACSSLARYAAECSRQGVCLDWRSDLCTLNCVAPLMYRSCVGCDLTCDNHDVPCNSQPAEGCYCPEGMVKLNNTCIEPSKCFPCDANRLHYAGDEWQEDACTKCTCTKPSGEKTAHTSCVVQSCALPICTDKEDLVTKPKAAGACCDQYLCVPKPQDTSQCEEPKQMECGYGQVLKIRTTGNGCKEFTCECKPSTECDPIPPENDLQLEPGMMRVVEQNGCCPRVTMVCQTESCPAKPQCADYYDVVAYNASGKCCPEYKCEPPKDKCIVTLEWESSPKGGEVPRTTSQTSLKELESHWSDGPCRNCECTVSGAVCTVITCPVVEANAEFEVEAQAQPFQCCPELVRVGCKFGERVYKAGENWTSSDDLCLTYQCVATNGGVEKITTQQTCHTDCELGWQYTPEPGKCCGLCKAVACVANGALHPINDHWTSADHCTNYTCVDVNSTLQVLSSDETCLEIPTAVRKLFVIDEKIVNGQCCKAHEYVACRDGNDIYQEGQTWQTSDPCKNLTCARDATNTLSHIESVQTCVVDCKPGWVYSEPNNTCCGNCVQVACVVGEEIKQIGSIWSSPDNCTSYSCERVGDQLTMTSSRRVCADLSACDPQDIVDDDGCCRKCLEKPKALSTCVPRAIEGNTSRVIRTRLGSHGVCVNDGPLQGFMECQGTCHSGTTYNRQSGLHESVCTCCQAVQYSGMTISLRCEDGTRQPHRVATPLKCECLACGGNSLQNDQDQNSTTDPDEIPEIYHRFRATGSPRKHRKRSLEDVLD